MSETKHWLLVSIVCLTIPLWFPFAIIGEFASIFFKKCKYRRHCKLYRCDEYVCNEVGGAYYGYDRYAGCYRSIEEKGKASSCWKE